METTFYDDQTYSSKDSIKNLKKTMTLDLNSARPPKKAKFSLLSSPDLNMLKLASPELENLIIQQNGVVTTTPTPTQFIFPRNVTEEQEMYARGFVDALAELHTGLTDAPNAATTNSSVTTTASFTTLTANNTITSTIPMPPLSNAPVSLAPVTSASGYPTTTSSSAFLNVPIKEEPQTVPNLGATPPLSPIDMENQERIKLERKRQRNRIAASKCRRRKLERIARLEDKVRLLKNENTELGNVVNQLREQVCQLKQQVMDHVSNGCQIMLSPQF